MGLGKKFVSGDDVFMMMSIAKIFGSRSITFLKSNKAIVVTKALRNISDFFDSVCVGLPKPRGILQFFLDWWLLLFC